MPTSSNPPDSIIKGSLGKKKSTTSIFTPTFTLGSANYLPFLGVVSAVTSGVSGISTPGTTFSSNVGNTL